MRPYLCSTTVASTAPSDNQNKEDGYHYELFSIMIHSGSAMAGHYYAYIMSFADEKQCYSFNDGNVSTITENDLDKSFGGQTSSTQNGYYTSYDSSMSAYMLMYRRIEPFRNVLPYTLSNLPCHVLALVDTMAKDKKDRALRASTTDHSPKKSPFYNMAKLPSLLSTTTTDNVRCKIFNCKTDFNDLNKKEKKRAFITHFNLHTLEQRKTQIDPSYELNLNKLGCGICTLCHRLASKTSQGALHKHSCITNTPMSSQATLIPIQDTISNP